jgi:hypothetical protein
LIFHSLPGSYIDLHNWSKVLNNNIAYPHHELAMGLPRERIKLKIRVC